MPDRLVRPPVLSSAEQEFLDAVGRDPAEYREALSYVASRVGGMRLSQENGILITPRMRAMLFQRLQGTGAHVPAATYTGAASAVDRDLTVAMARRWFGEQGALRVRLGLGPQIGAGVSAVGPTR